MKIYHQPKQQSLVRVTIDKQSITFCETTIQECVQIIHSILATFTAPIGDKNIVAFREFQGKINGIYKSFPVYGINPEEIINLIKSKLC